MRLYRYTYESFTEFMTPVTCHSFLLRAQPMDDEAQQVMDPLLEVTPSPDSMSVGTSAYSGVLHYGHVSGPHSGFGYRSTGLVRVTGRLRHDPCPNPVFSVHSNLCDFIPEMKSWCVCGTPLESAMSMAARIKQELRYSSGTTTVNTKASDAFVQGCGVCQDFSHILISLCRECSIPSRYVCGLVVGEGETHAWVEIWSEGIWYGIDPTSGKQCDDRYIALDFGRDASDCHVNRGVFTGVCTQKTETRVVVKEIDNQ